jgi:hypothetical protein
LELSSLNPKYFTKKRQQTENKPQKMHLPPQIFYFLRYTPLFFVQIILIHFLIHFELSQDFPASANLFAGLSFELTLILHRVFFG